MSTILLVSTVVSLVTVTIGFLHNVGNAYRSSALSLHRTELLQIEVSTLRGVVDECYETITGGPVQAPPHVQELMIACFEQGKEVEEFIVRAAEPRPDPSSVILSRLKVMLFILSSQGKQLDSSVAVFRDKVGMLRDACSDVRLRSQLVELSAGMARMMSLQEELKYRQYGFRDQKPFFNKAEQERYRYKQEQRTKQAQSSSLSALHGPSAAEGNNASRAEYGSQGDPQSHDHLQLEVALRDTLRTSLTSWAVDGYVLNGTVRVEDSDPETTATVLVEDPTKEGGERFKHVSAAVVPYYPARIKMDTGSTNDFVTLNYLERAGFNVDRLSPIPDEEQVEIEGLNHVMYKPRFKVNLKWYRQGESQMNDIPFFVVDQGPFDLLLSSHRFAVEAERRLFSLPLVRPWKRKTREQIGKEIKKEKKKLEEAKEQEQREFEAARANRVYPPGRVSTINTVAPNSMP